MGQAQEGTDPQEALHTCGVTRPLSFSPIPLQLHILMSDSSCFFNNKAHTNSLLKVDDTDGGPITLVLRTEKTETGSTKQQRLQSE